MIASSRNKRAIVWNHANRKTDYNYWYNLMYYDAVVRGLTFSEMKAKFPRPTLANRKAAYDAALEAVLKERSNYLKQQVVSTNQALQNQNLSVTPAGDVIDLTTGLVIRRATPLEMATLDEEADTSDNTKLILIVAAVAVVGILLFWEK